MKKRAGLYTETELSRIVELRGAGRTEKQIAEELGRPYNSVHCKIKEMRKDGRLPLVRDTTPVSDEDISALASKHRVTVGAVEYVIACVGSRMKNRLPDVDAALLAYNAQSACCVYFGVPIALVGERGKPHMAVLRRDKVGHPMWVSKMAAKMRGKLSHEMFLTSISTIYEHVFTKHRKVM